MAEQDEKEQKLLHETLAGVAAQLRGPLSVMYGGLRKLQEENTPGIEQLNRSYYQMLRLLGNLSAAGSLMGDPYYQLKRYNVDIVDLCRGVARQVESLAELKGLRFAFQTNEESCVICCHRRSVERLLLNLLSNALKFTPEGKKITLSVQVEKKTVRLCVTDQGCGIPAERLDGIFSRYLGSAAPELPPYGFGLGLPLCRAIAEAHGGKIFVESREGKGTRVTAVLPNEQTVIQRVRDAAFDETGGFSQVLVELSDAIPPAAFLPENL